MTHECVVGYSNARQGRVVDHADHGDADVDALHVLGRVAEKGQHGNHESHREPERRRW